MRRKNTLFSAALILLVLGSPVFAYQQVIGLGILGGYQYSRAQSINDNGQIVGYVYADVYDPPRGSRLACLFDSSGGGANVDLGALGGLKSSAYSINNNGKIVGRADIDYAGDVSPCLFDSTGNKNNKNLGMFGMVSSTIGAYCINDKDHIVGQSGGFSYVALHACFFDHILHSDLGTLGGSSSCAYSINNSDKVVGQADYVVNHNSYYHACLFDTSFYGGNNKDLGSLGGYDSIAYSINDSGLIVGQADFTTESPGRWYHACIFDASGGGDNIDLGTLGGFGSKALFVNNENQIVGSASDSSGQGRACLFDSTGQGNNINLNDLIDPSSGWVLKEADCINNNGWIVGYGTYNGIDQAFLLTPEPTSALLLVIGAALLRRKK